MPDSEAMAAARKVIRSHTLPAGTFFAGFLSIIMKAFVVGACPHILPVYTLAQVPVLVYFVLRGFRANRHLLYLAEFCWWANLVGWLLILAELLHASGAAASPYASQATRVAAARAMFVVANGPLAMTVLMNANSLVLHDPVRTSSFWIHFNPALTSWALKWYTESPATWALYRSAFGDSPLFALDAGIPPLDSPWTPSAFQHLYLVPLGVYFAWWLPYSLWLLSFGCNMAGTEPHKWGRSSFFDVKPTIAGLIGKERSSRTLAIGYLVGHATCVSVLLLISWLCYWSMQVHTAWLFTLLTSAIYNGAVFHSKETGRYLEKDMEKALAKTK